ncbi:MAG: tRNA 4-thiouridine(8) synthase ThiI [Clostridiales bacterium]|nr:tRNA 4-thiouridine(8) synthase ThiI [Clostridiales bacterium]
MDYVLIVRYSEIHLKGLNRPYFEKALVNRISHAISDPDVTVDREQGRIFVNGVTEKNVYAYAERLRKVFGIHSVSPAVAVEKDWDAVVDGARKLLDRYLSTLPGGVHTFKVFARRADKRFPYNSEMICKELGHQLLEAFSSLQVDVHHPEIMFGVEIRKTHAYLYCQEMEAVGGMPVGTNGRAMLLLSGGIDSPVAGYMIAKRGVSLDAVHFYSYPYTSERAREKVIDLAKQISEYSGDMTLHLVPFTDIQLSIYDNCPKAETTVIMRRLMMKIADRIAVRTGAQALITGESIGQVASQTMESLTVTNDAATLPVFRPLIGFDKDEIVSYAKKIGTFETSIQPFEDCCTIFVPQHPVTKPSLERILVSEQAVDFEPMIEKAIADTEQMVF